MSCKNEKADSEIKRDIIPNNGRIPISLIVFYHAKTSAYIQYFYRSIKPEKRKKSFAENIESQNPMKISIQIYLLRIRDAFVPPKPKEFVMAVLTSVFRAMLGT